MLRTRIDFTRLCQFNIKQDYRLRDCARGGGGSNFGLMTHLFKAGSPDLRRLQINHMHAGGGGAFWAKFSILFNMDFKIKRDYKLQRLSYANVDFARPKVDHADTSYMRSFSLARSNGMERKTDMQPSSSWKRMICHPLASRKKRYSCPLSNLSRRGLAEASRKPRASLADASPNLDPKITDDYWL